MYKMKFDKQVEKAKEEKLKNRIIRDVVFVILGITFLVISIICSYNKEKNNTNENTKANKVSINLR